MEGMASPPQRAPLPRGAGDATARGRRRRRRLSRLLPSGLLAAACAGGGTGSVPAVVAAVASASAAAAAAFSAPCPGPGPGGGGGGGGGLLLHAAPMQGYTNEHLRELLRGLSGGTVLWTEMEKVEDSEGYGRALSRCFPGAGKGGRGRRARARAGAGAEAEAAGPLVLQLGGSDAGRLAEAAAEAIRRDSGGHGLAGINLNCGCPSIESGGAATYGASLMANPAGVREAAEAVREAADRARAGLGLDPLAVSVKCRIGLHERIVPPGGALGGRESSFPEDDYGFLAAFVAEVSRTGALGGRGSVGGGVQVHARSAVLSGLSPLRNRSVPPLRPEFVHRLARDFPHLPVTLNGGIGGVGDARSLAGEALAVAAGGGSGSGSGEGVIDGIMLGRSVLARPLDLLLADDPAGPFRRLLPGGEGGGGGGGGGRGGRRPERSAAAAIAGYARYAAGEVAGSGRSAVGAVTVPLVLVAEQLREAFEALEGGRDGDWGGESDGPASAASAAALPPLLPERDLRDAFAAVWEGIEEIDAAAGGRNGRAGKILEGGASVLREVADGGAVPTRRLARLLKATMGKKVAGKVERNRSEVVRQGCA